MRRPLWRKDEGQQTRKGICYSSVGRRAVGPFHKTYFSTPCFYSRDKASCPCNSKHHVYSSNCPLPCKIPFLRRVHLFSSIAAPTSFTPHHLLRLLRLLPVLLLVCSVGGAEAQWTSTDDFNYHGGDGGNGGETLSAAEQKENWRITCYTCVNVSSNDECNRFAIDRPCPEGGDYCLTLHVMDALDREISVLVNKRCASLDDCSGEATGCTTTPHGQTQCVSCCDQPYCNDSVPSNSTNAVFYRSAASAMVAEKRQWDIVWTVASVLIIPVFDVLMLSGPS